MSAPDEYQKLLGYKIPIFGRGKTADKVKEARFKRAVGNSVLFQDSSEEALIEFKKQVEDLTEKRFGSTGPTLFGNLKDGQGDLKFALGVFLLFLKTPKYDGCALLANEALFGAGGSIEGRFGFNPRKTEVGTNKSTCSNIAGDTPSGENLDPILTYENSTTRLHYSSQHIDVVGRDWEQKYLQNFLNQEAGFQWLQLSGEGGQGKSRLAYELILKAANNWDAGFLNNKNLTKFKKTCKDWQPQNPTLIVVDYVLGSEEHLKPIFQNLAKRSQKFLVPVRLLLIERQRWDRGGVQKRVTFNSDGTKELTLSVAEGHAQWFIALCERDDAGDTHIDAVKFDKTGILELIQLDADDLVSIMRAEEELSDQFIAQDNKNLAGILSRIDGKGRPLFAIFLAQSILAGSFHEGFTKTDLLTDTLLRERRKRWVVEFGEDAPLPGQDTMPMRFAILASMTRGFDYQGFDLPGGWVIPDKRTFLRANVLNGGHLGSGVGVTGAIQEMQPDILAEWFVLFSMSSGLIDIDTIAQLAWNTNPTKMAEFLSRCSQDFPNEHLTKHLLEIRPNGRKGQEEYRSASGTIFQNFVIAEVNVVPKFLKSEFAELANESSDPQTNLTMAFCKMKGIVFQKDEADGLQRMLLSANSGNCGAMYNLGVCYKRGLGTKIDVTEAFTWVKKAAEAGVAEACFHLGTFYFDGYGVESNQQEAFVWIETAANGGVVNAMFRLGVMYQDSTGVKPNHLLSLEWLVRAARRGHPTAMFSLAVTFGKDECVEADQNKSIEWMQKAAEAGVAEAMYLMGLFYLDGEGVDTSPVTAFGWIMKAAEAGECEAMYSVAKLYYDGEGVDSSFSIAFRWLKKAAESGHMLAMYDLAECYMKGEHVLRDKNRADYWNSKAADLDGKSLH